ncbi:MAG TPA: DUF302 domain-containing protein [Actinomycetota bacterium]|nr:DUF302 domain-containing protein [Actinomycetota bacterium]
MSEYGYTVQVPEGYDEAVLRARVAMKGEGFSIISEMHVGGMLGPEAGDKRQYLIMGMWNAAVSQRQIDPQLQAGVHLPCNVVVQEVDAGAIVAALDPLDVVEDEDAPAVEAAGVAREALGRMLRSVAAGPG